MCEMHKLKSGKIYIKLLNIHNYPMKPEYYVHFTDEETEAQSN